MHRLRVLARTIALVFILVAAFTDVDVHRDRDGFITGWRVRLALVPPIVTKAVHWISG
jgi:hypothetical protein